MPVAAALVVRGERRRLHLVEDRGQARGGFVDVGGPERLGVVHRLGVDHPGVAIAEELDRLTPRIWAALPRFACPTLGEGLVRIEHAVVHLADVATSHEHEHAR